MTARERTMTAAVATLLAVGVGGYVAYGFYWEPARLKTKANNALRVEIDERQMKVNAILEGRKRMAVLQKISLPADVNFAQVEYESFLNLSLRASGFEPGTLTIVPKAVDDKSAPSVGPSGPGQRKPAYKRLGFSITARGDLATLVDWMQRFYKAPLLQRLTNLTVTRPVSAESRGRAATDLDINVTAEALVLDGAENRTTLQPPEPPPLPEPLVTGRNYAAIAGKDVFFGPPAAAAPASAPKPSVDFAQFVKCTKIGSGARGLVADLWDVYNDQYYKISPRLDGTFNVEVQYRLNDKKRRLRSGAALELQDENGDNQHKWEVVAVTDREVLLKSEGQYYGLRAGRTLGELEKLTAAQVKQRGVEVSAAEGEAPKR